MVRGYWIVFIVVATMLLTGCSQKVSKKISALSEQKVSAARVKTQVVTPVTFHTEIDVVAQTEAYNDLVLRPSGVGGRIEKMSVKVGDLVQKGQVVALIDSRMAEAQFGAALSAYETARSAYERQKNLHDRELASSQTLEGIRAQYDAAKAQLEIAKLNRENAGIVSPIDGVVAERFVDKGDVVGPGVPMMNIVDISKLKVVVGVSQQDISKITKNQAVMVKIDPLGKEYEGYVESVGLKASAMNKTFPVTVVFWNPGQRVKAGSLAEVSIRTGTIQNAIVLRHDYVLEQENSRAVAIVENGKVKISPVELGERNHDTIQILSGVRSGDHVVIEGQRDVFNGEPVVSSD